MPRRSPAVDITGKSPDRRPLFEAPASERAMKEDGMATATKVTLKPLEDRVVVQANEAETQTASGLVIPDTAKEKPQEGTVIAVGPGRISDQGERIALDVKEGDTVVYSKYGGTEIKLSGEEYLILSARDILAIVER
jgi:chaperonin GroES